uniref:KIAA0319 n=1 Tax=Anolis carolinensis TaxID=28377 RepID=G1KAX5_ANOCA|nr:PREDICTED: dyslexia-associated protein KIAA0319 homolog isoform X1 [Anolis carolinensis]|eukprot:XP_008106997.1 PREDICTED: dyslexia-associated protein KIAA0319 homolog isoform X1 [Anolis carolinensis]
MSRELGRLGAFCLVLGAFTGYFCEECREGAKYSDAIISPNLETAKIMRVPHAVSMSDCSAACCDLSDCDLSWMFEGHCYIVSCQHKGNCEPKKMEKVKSYLTFVLRPPQRSPSLLEYEQMPSNLIHSMALQGETSEDISNLKELSFLSKEHSLEDYSEEYGEVEQIPFQLSFKHEAKEGLNYADWGLRGNTENGINASGLSHGDKHEELAENEKEKTPLENPTNIAESERNPATEHPGQLPEITLDLIEESVNEIGSQHPNEANNTWQEEVLTPSHNPPPSDIPGFLSITTAQTQTSDGGNLVQDETTSFPTSAPATQPFATDTLSYPSTTTKAVKKLLVSAGDNLQITLPKNQVELHASVVTPSLSETPYNYEWSLISHPEDYGGEMEGRHTSTLRLSQLSVGCYLFQVTVTAENAIGEGYVNVTVQPAIRINQPPVAVVSPKAQEISFPTTSTFIDGTQSTDDTKIVTYHWQEIEGPQREKKASADTPVLHLFNLVPGNYTFRLMVVDSDGAADSTLAFLRVNKQMDFPPVANAGPNQEISLPQNTITLNGNQSKDDHGIVGYEWSLSPKSKNKLVTMEGVRSPYLRLSSLKEGDYTLQLTVTDSAEQQSTTEVTIVVQPEKNSPPRAVTGPNKELTFPDQSAILDGSKSTDDFGIVYYHWENISGPSSLQMENVDSAIATVTGLQIGTYYFRLTVKDGQGLSSSATLSVTVKQEKNHPPQARAGGKHILVLPNNSIALDGSQSVDDQGIVSYLWIRDGQSPAAGDVIHGSDHEAILQLTNLVEGSYAFHLKVIDEKGDSDIDTAVVEVQPDPKKSGLVELILDVGVGQLTEQQKDTLVRQIAVLLNVLDSDIKVQKIQAYSDISTAVVFYVQNGHPFRVIKASDVAQMLRLQLLKEKPEFLLFKVLRIDTDGCLLKCSGHGHCDPITKQCICYQLWMENLIQRYLDNGESNCEWSVLYVTVSAFVLIVLMVGLAWLCICCCKSRKRTKIRKKTKYTILDNIDDQERMELRPKYGIKHRSTEHNSSLMVSESEFDSDQDTIFSREKMEKENSRNSMNGSVKNGVSFSYTSKDR